MSDCDCGHDAGDHLGSAECTRCSCTGVVAPADSDDSVATTGAADHLALADALATAERALAASREAWATLAAAVREEREAERAMGEALAATNRTPTRPGERIERYNAFCAAEGVHVAAHKRVDALLSDAPAPSTVPAAVVRAYLDAREAVPEGFDADYAGADERARVSALRDAADEARAALDAALARCP